MDLDKRRDERLRKDEIFTRHRPRVDEFEPTDNFWDHAVEVWDVVRPAWWPILITFLLCFLVLGVGQIRDLLSAMTLESSPVHGTENSAGVSGRYWTTIIACGIYAFMAWAFGRGLLSIRFPFTPCPFDPPDWHVVVRMAVSRLLGLALPLSCFASYWSMGMYPEAFPYAILALILFVVFWATRKYLHDWIDVQHEQDLAEERARSGGAPLSEEEAQNAERADVLDDVDEALHRAEETLEEASREKNPELQKSLLERVSELADIAGNAAKAAGNAFQEADLFDQTMPRKFPPQMQILLYGILGFHLLAAIVFFIWPVLVPQAIGAAAVLFLGIAGWMSFGVFVFCYWTRFWKLPPALLLFAIWLAIASQFNDNHEIARLAADKTPDVPAPTLDSYIETWLDNRLPYLPKTEDDPEFPIIVITAEGGGARAAYWSGSVMADLEQAAPQSGLATRDHIFLISGVSGGSVGTASFGVATVSADYDPKLAQERVDEFLQQDFLSPVTAGALYFDFFSDFIPVPISAFDRARWLEGAWKKGWQKTVPGAENFGEDFRALWDESKGRKGLGSLGAVPLLIYNTTSVRTGSVWRVSPVRLSDEPGCSSHDFVDLVEADGRGMPLATAAHLSARFTGISPAGRIDLKGYDDCPADGFDRFVDGAYYENSGGDTAVWAVRRLQQRIFQYCYPGLGKGPIRCNASKMPVVAVAIISEKSPPANPPAVSHETTSILMTVANTRTARGEDALERLEAVSSGDLEKIELAIGWTRGEDELGCSQAAADKAHQVHDQREAVNSRSVPLGWALSQSAVDHMCRERLSNETLKALKSRLEGPGD